MPTDLTDRAAAALSRTRLGGAVSRTRAEVRVRRVQPTWTSLLGAVSIGSAVVLLVTGVILMFFYVPSSQQVVYRGGYAPLHGAEVSKAFASTLGLSMDVSGGLLLRQAHHWAGLLLPAALILQLVTTFFSGAFRGPRRWAWALLVLLIVAVLADGWSGYALPDDLLSGTGLRIVQGIVLAIPLVGTWISALLFGGAFPGTIIENLYPLHVAIIPVVIVALIVLRARVTWRAGPTRIPVARPRPPRPIPFASAAARSLSIASITAGILLLMGATVTISPVWLSGPSDPGSASAGSQPDWYTGFLDGALRLVPPGWEIEWLGRTWTLAVLVPLAVIGAFVLAVLVHPWLERWLTGDGGDANVLDRPRNMPARTGVGVAALIFYGTLWGAASADVIANQFQVGLENVILTFQVMLFAGPVIGFEVTRRAALGLQARDAEQLAHGFETGRIVRLPGGRYEEIHRQLDAETARALGTGPITEAIPTRHGDGWRTPLDVLRVTLAHWYERGARRSAPDAAPAVAPAAVPAALRR
ncbi:MAG: cytochrome b N-terminal domain-containing protein [Pseudolysinimonas sp.]